MRTPKQCFLKSWCFLLHFCPSNRDQKNFFRHCECASEPQVQVSLNIHVLHSLLQMWRLTVNHQWYILSSLLKKNTFRKWDWLDRLLNIAKSFINQWAASQTPSWLYYWCTISIRKVIIFFIINPFSWFQKSFSRQCQHVKAWCQQPYCPLIC